MSAEMLSEVFAPQCRTEGHTSADFTVRFFPALTKWTFLRSFFSPLSQKGCIDLIQTSGQDLCLQCIMIIALMSGDS